MTYNQLIAKAIILLGYADEHGNTSDPRFQLIAKNAVNFISADIIHCLGLDTYSDVENLSEEIRLPNRVIYDVMPYGVAAFIAESLGDGEKQQYFASLYNRKRTTVNYESNIQDVIPTP